MSGSPVHGPNKRKIPRLFYSVWTLLFPRRCIPHNLINARRASIDRASRLARCLFYCRIKSISSDSPAQNNYAYHGLIARQRLHPWWCNWPKYIPVQATLGYSLAIPWLYHRGRSYTPACYSGHLFAFADIAVSNKRFNN